MASVGARKKSQKKSRAFIIAVTVLLLAVVSVIAAVMITNDGKLDAAGFQRLFSGTAGQSSATEFSFDAGLGSVFADLDGGLAVCSVSGLQVYDKSAGLTYRETFEMACPTICQSGKKYAVYDLGGQEVKIFDSKSVTKSYATDGKIISASLNSDGWLALITQEDGLKGLVSVYNAGGDNVYQFKSAKGYVLGAQVSPDSKSLAVLTLGEDGSRVVFFKLNSTDEQASCTLSGALALELRFSGDGLVLAAAADALTAIRTDGTSTVLLAYEDKYLADYSLDGSGFTVLVVNNYLVADNGSILTVDKSGHQLGSLDTDRRTLSVSARGNSVAVLYSDGLVLYDRNLEELARSGDTTGAEKVILRADGTALIIKSHSATVFNPAAG